jgi:membrane protein implicated in regulation of membrane protease activity
MSNTQKAIWWFLTGAAAVAEGIMALVGNVPWYGQAIAVAAAIASILLGRPWTPPAGPTA